MSSVGYVSLTRRRATESAPRPRLPSPASGDGRDDRDLIAGLERGLGALQEADVFLVDVEVDEAAHLPAIVHETLFEPGILLLEIVDQPPHRIGGGLHLGLPLRQGAERCRNSHEHGHITSPWLARLRRRLWISSQPAPGRTRPATGGWSRPRTGDRRRHRAS